MLLTACGLMPVFLSVFLGRRKSANIFPPTGQVGISVHYLVSLKPILE